MQRPFPPGWIETWAHLQDLRKEKGFVGSPYAVLTAMQERLLGPPRWGTSIKSALLTLSRMRGGGVGPRCWLGFRCFITEPQSVSARSLCIHRSCRSPPSNTRLYTPQVTARIKNHSTQWLVTPPASLGLNFSENLSHLRVQGLFSSPKWICLTLYKFVWQNIVFQVRCNNSK